MMPDGQVQRLANSASGLMASYDTESQALTVVFPNGRRYVYEGVPPDLWRGLQEAGSAGKFFNDNIRGVY